MKALGSMEALKVDPCDRCVVSRIGQAAGGGGWSAWEALFRIWGVFLKMAKSH